MFATRKQRPRQRRRGIVLLIVLTMLTLFALVGVSFVLIASSQETSARIAREAETNFRPTIDPEAAFAFALGQIIYDFPDGKSSLWGHGLARNMYGYNPAAINDKPFSGFGRISYPSAFGQDEMRLLSYHEYPDRGNRAPETYNGQYFPTAAVPYTYPDHNNFYLAQIGTDATGNLRVLTPSFHREYLFGRLDDVNNPNWDFPQGKYKTLRPTRQYHPKFPMPLDRGGDVKNLDGLAGGCDSIWIDIGAPVMTAPDGTRYKMLIAPLILDLDGRINLNVAGNLLGTARGDHRSNQGWGPWEVNLAKVLNADANEWRNVFDGFPNTGLARVRGRYDNESTRGFGQANKLPGGRQPRAWAQVDYNGAVDTGANAGNPSPHMIFPTAMQPNYYTGFPVFATDSYANGNVENTDHASVFNPIRPNTDLNASPKLRHRLFGSAEMNRLLRTDGTGYSSHSSDLIHLLRTNLVTDAQAALRRQQVTTLSADLDRPAIVPYYHSDSKVTLDWTDPDPTDRAPLPTLTATPLALPPLGAAPANSEFNPQWRSTLLQLAKMDMKQRLPNYPAPDAMTGIADPVGTKTAQDARQKFAQDIFDRLAGVTGHRVNLNDYSEIQTEYTSTNPPGQSPKYRAIRALAQLAVNMVDYIDGDDISTRFEIPGSGEFVFGFEQPRLVINEVYVSIDNKKNDIEDNAGKRVKMDGNYNIHIWAELMNPLIEDTLTGTPNPDCTVNLHKGGITTEANYRLLVVDADRADPNGKYDPATAPVTVLRRPDNPLGSITTGIVHTLDKWSPTDPPGPADPAWRIAPSVNHFDGTPPATPAANHKYGFFVVGPNVTAGDYDDPDKDDPQLPTPSLATPKMTWEYPAKKFDDTLASEKRKPRPMLVLQRLANPNQPHNPTPGNDYNPYITIDYFDCRPGDVIDARRYDTMGETNTAKPLAERTSIGRRQPYAACWSERRAQQKPSRATPPNPKDPPLPQHTFFYQNCAVETKAELDAANSDATLKLPFDWLVHLDRMPISAAELLHTSALRPCDVLQYFVVDNTAHQHKAPWLTADTRLHRFLEFVSRSSYAGIAVDNPASPSQSVFANWGTPNGRIPGLININTMPAQWGASPDSPVFRALADANAANGFTDAQINTILAELLNQRTPATTTGDHRAGPTDSRLLGGEFTQLNRPFLSLGIGSYNNSSGGDPGSQLIRGMEQSILRNNSASPPQPLLDVPGTTIPYQQKELLTKIFNNFTTRSNCFAVWITVGFFKVESTSANQPPVLGEEVGKSENRQVRYRMFAIVDRTRLRLAEGKLQAAISPPTNPLAGVTITVKDLHGPLGNPPPAALQNGTVLIIDPGLPNEEAVVVRNPSGLNGTVDIRYPHGANAVVVWPGNPGPINKYDLRKDPDVVPYWALID